MSILESAVALIRGESTDPPDDRELQAGRERLTTAERAVDEASLAVEAQETGAAKRLERARADLVAAKAEVDRLERARRLAAEREAARVQRHHEEERRREAAALHAAQVKLREQVAKADAKLGELASVLEGVMRAQDAVLRHAPGAVQDRVADLNRMFWPCLTWRLKFMPNAVLRHPFLGDENAQWSKHCPQPGPAPAGSDE
jgi:hypothetical protein